MDIIDNDRGKIKARADQPHLSPPAWRSNARVVGDIRPPVHASLDRYEAVERKAQVIETDATFGDHVEQELAAVRKESADAMADFIAARADYGNMLLGGFRACKGDETLKYAMHLELLDHLEPTLDEISDRFRNIEAVVTATLVRVTNLEAVLSRRASA